MADVDRTTALAGALLAGAAQTGEHRSLRAVEIGIGGRTAVAEALVDRGAVVLATDVVERAVPQPIGFRLDDLRDPDRSLYCGADLLYALRLPPELHEAFARLAVDVDVPAAFTTLGGDPVTVATTPEQVPGGETAFWLSETISPARPHRSDRRDGQ